MSKIPKNQIKKETQLWGEYESVREFYCLVSSSKFALGLFKHAQVEWELQYQLQSLAEFRLSVK